MLILLVFNYDLITRFDLPLYFGDFDAFEEYIKVAHNSRFSTEGKPPVEILSNTIMIICAMIIDSLSGVSSIAITSNIWPRNVKQDYLSVVLHYVNCGWQLAREKGN